MKKILLICLCCVILAGCASPAVQTQQEVTEATLPTFPDGDPENVTCLGSYTSLMDRDAVVARAGSGELTNGELQAWYWAQAAQYRNSGAPGPDFGLPLDRQACDLDEDVATWQQYFLKQALASWHTAQALADQGEEEGVPTEKAYNPYPGNYEKYMDGMPATQFLYGYSKSFRPNTMHQAYLDGLPEQLDGMAQGLEYASADDLARQAMGTDGQSLLEFARSYNLGYMYFTSLSYLLEPTQEEIVQYAAEHFADVSGTLVDFRHILVSQPGDPEKEPAEEAAALLKKWDKDWRASESTFATLAYEHSQDAGTIMEGGLYRRVEREQIPEELADWCFSAQRRPGDTVVLESSLGAHVVYFVSAMDKSLAQAEQELRRQMERSLLETAREKYPMEVCYADIVLAEGMPTVAMDDVLYADLAHQRFPEVPLYLQQDYPGVMYGGYELRTNGCGITTFAMVASYLSDEEWTPPEMCAKFGNYSFDTGTDGSLFQREPAGLDFYLICKTYEWREAREYMQQGYLCVVVQHSGYWTRGGHYLVLEKEDENGMVQVRDSNLYNYMNIREGHSKDRFSWGTINPRGMGYWVFDYKDVTNAACTRCGKEEGRQLCTNYLCKTCEAATLRRNTYLES